MNGRLKSENLSKIKLACVVQYQDRPLFLSIRYSGDPPPQGVAMGSENSRPAESQSSVIEPAPSFFRKGGAFRSISTLKEVPEPRYWLDVLNCTCCGHLICDGYLMCDKEGHLTCYDCNWQNKGLVCQFRHAAAPAPESPGKPEKASSEKSFGEESQTDTESGTDSRGSSMLSVYYSDEKNQKVSFDDEKPGTSKALEEWNEMVKVTAEVEASLEPVCCGGKLSRRPNVIVDKLLMEVDLVCPYWREGCKATVPIMRMRRHYKMQCQFKPKAAGAAKSNPGSSASSSSSYH